MNEQPRFYGPGIYGIVTYQHPSLCCNSWGGTIDANEAVKLRTITTGGFADNELWQFALATSQGGEESKYIILNVRNGYYLAAKDDGTISCSNKTPTDSAVLWTISSVSQSSNDYHVFQLKNGLGGQLTIADGYTQGAKLTRGDTSSADNTKFYIVSRAPS